MSNWGDVYTLTRELDIYRIIYVHTRQLNKHRNMRMHARECVSLPWVEESCAWPHGWPMQRRTGHRGCCVTSGQMHTCVLPGWCVAAVCFEANSVVSHSAFLWSLVQLTP